MVCRSKAPRPVLRPPSPVQHFATKGIRFTRIDRCLRWYELAGKASLYTLVTPAEAGVHLPTKRVLRGGWP